MNDDKLLGFASSAPTYGRCCRGGKLFRSDSRFGGYRVKTSQHVELQADPIPFVCLRAERELLLLMRQLNMLNPNCAITLPRSLSREGRGKFKPLSLDGRGVGERVEFSPYLIAPSIEVPDKQTRQQVRRSEAKGPVSRASARVRAAFK